MKPFNEEEARAGKPIECPGQFVGYYYNGRQNKPRSRISWLSVVDNDHWPLERWDAITIQPCYILNDLPLVSGEKMECCPKQFPLEVPFTAPPASVPDDKDKRIELLEQECSLLAIRLTDCDELLAEREGCVLVPLEPTSLMVDCGMAEHTCFGPPGHADFELSEGDCKGIYRAMLATAEKESTCPLKQT